MNNTIVIGTCKCGGYGQVFDEATEKELGMCHREIPKTCLTDGSPVTEDHREIDETTGQQKGYVVLCPEERDKGFVRPLRHTYVHDKCGGRTTMGNAIAETYARDPQFYDGTFCVHCGKHFPLSEFKWDGTDEVVGS